LTEAGAAELKFRPGIGSHSYKAVFLGTNTYAGSASDATALKATGIIPPLATATTINQAGSWGAYTLSATVTETGNTAPPTGTVLFLDTNHGNAVLGAGKLGAATRDVEWSTVNTSAPSVTAVIYAVADLNRDGIPDLFVKDYFGTYDVLLGKGDGTFTVVGSPFGPSSETGSFVVGDFNNDGIPDVAAINAAFYASSGNNITIFLGNGDGTFTVAASSPALGYNPTAIATADINGDGNADLIVAQQGSSTSSAGQVAIFFGHGDGTFTEASSTTSVASAASSIIPTNLDGDGHVDLILSGEGASGITVLLGKGDGTFTSLAGPSQAGEAAVEVADVNNDGFPDLVFGAAGTSDLTVFLGNGDGTFTEAPGSPNVNIKISDLAIADFNQDGIPDIAYTYGVAGILFGNGDGTFVESPATLTYPYDFSGTIVVGDFNGDGRPDVLTEDGNSRTVIDSLTQPTETAAASAAVSIAVAGTHLADASYPGNSNYKPSASGNVALWGAPPATTTSLKVTSGGTTVSSVTPGTVVTLTAEVKTGGVALKAGQVNFCQPTAPHCTDFDLLGTAAITGNGTATYKFVPGPGQHSYQAKFVEEGLGQGSASNQVSLTVGPAPPVQYSATTTIASSGQPGNYSLTATVEGFGGTAAPTGKVSFVDTSFSDTVLATAELGAATPGIGWIVGQTPVLDDAPVAEVAGDFNGDGIPDLALLWTDSVYGGPYWVRIFFGNGDGTFTGGPTTQATGVQAQPTMIAGDFNGDGKTDLAILSMSELDTGNPVTVLPGDGDGTFGQPITSVAPGQPNQGGDVISGSLVAADFNGDGKLDLGIVGDSVDNGGITILLGKGDGSFTAAGPSTDASQGFPTIATGDFNGDGIPDLVATTYFNEGSATIFLGKGDGTFSEGEQLSLGNFPSAIVVGDFNGDGRLDLAFGYAAEYGGGVTVYLGKGDGTFSQAPGSPFSGAGQSLVTGDFNNDGKLDLAGIDSLSDQIDLFEGAGDGTFKEVVITPNVGQNTPGPFQIVAADFNGKGVPDLAMLTRNVDTVTILQTQPTETATAAVTGIAPVGAGTHSVEASYAGDSHYGKSVSSTVQLTAGLEAPVISPASGTYTAVQKITITEAIPGATIYYQAYGTVNTNGYVEYAGPFFLPYGGFEQISAYATETGYQQSNYTNANYDLILPAAPEPVFSPAAGSYKETQTVTITDAAQNATIYYTTNGAYPTQNSTVYSGPVTVSTSELISAIALAPGYSASGVGSAQYLIDSSQSRFVYTVAGTQAAGYSGDGGPAAFATLEGPTTLARSGSGDLYIADGATVRKVAAGTGIITTAAGNGFPGYSGDGKLATNANLSYVDGLAIDKAGDLYISDESNCVVRKVTAGTGIITTVAGNGTCGYSGDKGPATKAQLNYLSGLALDKAGNLYIGMYGAVRMVAAATGTITTFAGTGNGGYSGDNGPAAKAQVGLPVQIVFDASGNLYFVDSSDDVVRKVAAGTTIISTVAGTGPATYPPPTGNGDGGPATSATLSGPTGLAIDTAGDLFISDNGRGSVREVTASNKIINTIAGGASNLDLLGSDGGPALAADLHYPGGLAIDQAGNLYIADAEFVRVREITALVTPPATATAAPVLSLAPGTYSAAKTLTITAAEGAEVYLKLDGSTPTTAGEGYYTPIAVAGPVTVSAIALAPGYLPSAEVKATYNVTAPAPATITTVAGSGTEGLPGSGGPALQAEFDYPYSVATDKAGNLYIADIYEGAVWKLTAATNTVSVAAGTPGTLGYYSGEGGPAAKAIIGYVNSVALDSAGDLFISDSFNYRVYKVAAQTGIITTYAGGGMYEQYPTYGDGGPATQAVLRGPLGITLDSAGNLYIADAGADRVRKVNAATGIISSVAGATGATALGDGGPATAATLSPENMAFDASGNLYIVDRKNERIREVNAKTGIISTVAGTGIFGFGGDGGPANGVPIGPFSIAIDASGAIYFSNVDNTIRKFVPGGDISTVAGTGYWGFAGDGGPARMAEICGAAALGFDKAGNLYIADGCNFRVRKVSFSKADAEPAF
jgi:sugar lactone lactonase YvrE